MVKVSSVEASPAVVDSSLDISIFGVLMVVGIAVVTEMVEATLVPKGVSGIAVSDGVISTVDTTIEVVSDGVIVLGIVGVVGDVVSTIVVSSGLVFSSAVVDLSLDISSVGVLMVAGTRVLSSVVGITFDLRVVSIVVVSEGATSAVDGTKKIVSEGVILLEIL